MLIGILNTIVLNCIRLKKNTKVDSLGNAFVLLFVGKYGPRILRHGMKKALDQYINSNYAEVRAYTAYFLSKMGSYIDADTVINNSYLHVVNIDGDPDKIKGYLLNTIKYQILWSTSKSHKDDKITAIEHQNTEPVDDDDLMYKLKQDKIYSFNKGLIEIYRKEIKDKIQLIVFEAYIDKGYITSRALATYFGITHTSAYYLIKELKQNINKLQYRYENEPNN
jgi:hypothetical protein